MATDVRRIIDIMSSSDGLTLVSSWFARIMTVSVSLVTIPVMLGSLSVAEYAIYAILVGLNLWFALMDFGMGKANQNSIVIKLVKGESISDLIVTTNLLLGIVAVIVLFALWCVKYPAGDFLFRSASSIGGAEKSTYFFIGASLMLVAGCSGVVVKQWYGLGQGYIGNFIVFISQLITLLGCLYVSRQAGVEGKLLGFIIFYFFPIALLLCLSVGGLWGVNYFKGGRFRLTVAFGIIREARGFFVLGFMSAFVLGFDYIILSQYVSVEDITVYSIAARLFSAVYIMFNVVLLVLWPRLTRLSATGRLDKLRKGIRSAIVVGCVYVFISTSMLLLFGNKLLSMIGEEGVSLPTALLLLFGMYYFVRVWVDVFSTLLQSQGELWNLYWAIPLQVVISIGLQVLLVQSLSYYGVLIAVMLSYLLTMAWVLPMSARKFLVSK